MKFRNLQSLLVWEMHCKTNLSRDGMTDDAHFSDAT